MILLITMLTIKILFTTINLLKKTIFKVKHILTEKITKKKKNNSAMP